jgi:hypothetical protein
MLFPPAYEKVEILKPPDHVAQKNGLSYFVFAGGSRSPAEFAQKSESDDAIN